MLQELSMTLHGVRSFSTYTSYFVADIEGKEKMNLLIILNLRKYNKFDQQLASKLSMNKLKGIFLVGF